MPEELSTWISFILPVSMTMVTSSIVTDLHALASLRCVELLGMLPFWCHGMPCMDGNGAAGLQ